MSDNRAHHESREVTSALAQAGRARLGRRKFITHAMAAAGGAALGSSALRLASAASAPLTGTVETWGVDARDAAIASQKWWDESFEAANPGVKVNSLVVSNGDMSAKIQAAHAAGIPPDMFWTFGDLNYTYGVNGIARRTNDLLAQVGIKRFPSTLLDSIRLRGTFYSVPFIGFPFMLYYRKDMYKAKGLKPPTTHDELLANIQALHQPPTTYGYVLTNKNLADTWNLKTAMFSHGAYYFDAHGNLALDRPATIEAWNFYKQLGKYTPPGSMEQNDVGVRQLMLDGKVAHMFTTTSFAANFSADDIQRQGAAPYPLKPGAKGVSLDFYGFILPVRAKRPDLGDAEVRWIMDPQHLEEYLVRTVVGWVPMVTDGYTQAYLNNPRIAPFREYFEVGKESAKTGIVGTGYFGPTVKSSVLVATDIEKQIGDRLVVLNQDPKQVLDWAVSVLTPALK
jgi:ABC-type glycerol-3-phosphate transport system substrate-binding protein